MLSLLAVCFLDLSLEFTSLQVEQSGPVQPRLFMAYPDIVLRTPYSVIRTMAGESHREGCWCSCAPCWEDMFVFAGNHI